jgi:hypothetical protein
VTKNFEDHDSNNLIPRNDEFGLSKAEQDSKFIIKTAVRFLGHL